MIQMMTDMASTASVSSLLQQSLGLERKNDKGRWPNGNLEKQEKRAKSEEKSVTVTDLINFARSKVARFRRGSNSISEKIRFQTAFSWTGVLRLAFFHFFSFFLGWRVELSKR